MNVKPSPQVPKKALSNTCKVCVCFIPSHGRVLKLISTYKINNCLYYVPLWHSKNLQFKTLKHSSNHTHTICTNIICPHFHMLRYYSHNEQRLFLQTTLRIWYLYRLRYVFSVTETACSHVSKLNGKLYPKNTQNFKNQFRRLGQLNPICNIKCTVPSW